MRSKIVNLLTIAVAFVTIFQGIVPSLPLQNAATLTVISSIAMFLASTLTIWKQRLSAEIDNKALWPTIIVAMIATFGGLNDLMGVFHFSAIAGQWIRFTITFITMSLNLVSKVFYPTEETKSIL